jgi:hypothetical protein
MQQVSMCAARLISGQAWRNIATLKVNGHYMVHHSLARGLRLGLMSMSMQVGAMITHQAKRIWTTNKRLILDVFSATTAVFKAAWTNVQCWVSCSIELVTSKYKSKSKHSDEHTEFTFDAPRSPTSTDSSSLMDAGHQDVSGLTPQHTALQWKYTEVVMHMHQLQVQLQNKQAKLQQCMKMGLATEQRAQRAEQRAAHAEQRTAHAEQRTAHAEQRTAHAAAEVAALTAENEALRQVRCQEIILVDQWPDAACACMGSA